MSNALARTAEQLMHDFRSDSKVQNEMKRALRSFQAELFRRRHIHAVIYIQVE